MREQRLKLWQQWRRLEKRIRAKDELYDVSMLRGYHCKNDGYGELLPCFSKQIAEVLNLHKSHKVVDVGSGIGLLCFDLACISGCNVKGIEIRRDIFLKSVQIAKHISERMDLDVSFVYGDGTADTIPFRNMDVIICCNTLWSGENNYRLLQKLCLQMRPGTRVVVLEQLGGQRYHEKSPRQQNDILSSCFHVPPQKFMSQPESVSWTSNPIPFYVYTKKAISREMKDRLEKDRAGVLRTPKHRTDPHVAEMAGKKRTSQEIEEEVFVMPRKRNRKADVKKEVVEISDDSDSEMDSEDSEIESEVRVTRSAAKLAEAKVSKSAKTSSARNSKNSRTSSKKTTRARTTRVTRATTKDASDKSEDEEDEEEDDESVTITAKKRRKRVVGVITSRIRKRTRVAIAKRQQQQQQQQQRQKKLIKQQKQKQDKEEKQPIEEEEEQRVTRSQAKVSSSCSSPSPSRSPPRSTTSSSPSSLSSSSSSSSSPSRSSTSPSFPSSPSSPSPTSPHSPSSPSTPSFTTRSQVSSSTQFSSLPTIFRATKKSPQQSFDKEAKAARKWSSPESEGKVSERRSQRFKKFNMNLNDFIA